MFNRQMVKANGKVKFQANYWRAVLVALILSFLTASASTGSTQLSHDDQQTVNTTLENLSDPESLTLLGLFTVTFILVLIFAICVSILLVGPLKVGCRQFFLTNLNQKAMVGNVGYAFGGGRYKNIVLTMFMTNLKILLWSFLFIVPGIIKAYSYRMVEYIMCENPEMNWKDAQALSRQMMNGNKWDAFVYDVSFIGWIILSCLTCGLVGIFYYAPYKGSSDAALYEALKGAQSM